MSEALVRVSNDDPFLFRSGTAIKRNLMQIFSAKNRSIDSVCWVIQKRMQRRCEMKMLKKMGGFAAFIWPPRI
jgi:hypothetical protein